MHDLTAVGVTPDGRRLLLADADGAEYAVPVDATLRGLLDPDITTEKKMDSALRPRDIQARIRAGESPETVAGAAGTSVEAIMGFATPVLAERAHVARSARQASVRRRTQEVAQRSEQGARTLGETADLFFARHALHEEDVAWDAWRRPDGRWVLVAEFALEGRDRVAEFTHDVAGRFVVAENDEARVLTGELRPGGDVPPEQRERRLTSVAAAPTEDSLGDDALEMVRDEPEPEPEPEPESEPAVEGVEKLAPEEPALFGEPAAAPAATARRKGRSSVPSWDEIMFGGGAD